MDNNEQSQPDPANQQMEPNTDVSTNPRLRHSGLGIASFTMAILSIILTIVIITMIIGIASNADIFNNLDLENPTITQDDLEQVLDEYPELPVLFMSFFLVGGLVVIGGILGLIGLFIKERKKLFAVLGTILNFFGIFVVFIMVILGLVFS